MGDKQGENVGKLSGKPSHALPVALGVEVAEGSAMNGLGNRDKEDGTKGHDTRDQAPRCIHENGMDSGFGLNKGSIIPF